MKKKIIRIGPVDFRYRIREIRSTLERQLNRDIHSMDDKSKREKRIHRAQTKQRII